MIVYAIQELVKILLDLAVMLAFTLITFWLAGAKMSWRQK